jgi:predicted HD phosphohydrolase
LYAIKVQIRQWDDAAKVVDLKVPDLEYYRPIAIRHLLEQKDRVTV